MAHRGVVLGLSADLHDAAAALVIDGEIVAAAEEERFSRRKHDPSLPVRALSWCLEVAGIGSGGIDVVAFNAKPLTMYERMLSSSAMAGPTSLPSLVRGVRGWASSKLWIAARIERALRTLGHPMPRLVYCPHHLSHAASAFLASPFERAAIMTFDGVGEWATSSIGVGEGGSVQLLEEQRYPHSLGLFYSALTVHCGFPANEGEYRLMGLAPYGRPTYAERLLDRAIRVDGDGAVALDLRFFGFDRGRRMGSRRLDAILDGPPLPLGAPPGPREADIAASAQLIVERAMLAAARRARRIVGSDDLCLAGGVAFNCVANGVLAREAGFDRVWVQPAAGDAGGALGAALWCAHEVLDQARAPDPDDSMRGGALGPAFSTEEVAQRLDALGVQHRRLAEADRCDEVAARLEDGQLVGWMQGPMEFGPRALGHRSILADSRRPEVVEKLNAKVKRREGFRPFAPAVLAERASDYFDLADELPYMTQTVQVKGAQPPGPSVGASFAERLASVRSPIPACTHVDGSARVQTVDARRSPQMHRLLRAFERRTGCPVVVNTSFNGAGEPIVCSPEDAVSTGAAIGLDLVVIEGCLIEGDELTRWLRGQGAAAGALR